MKYIVGILGLIGILLWLSWGAGRTSLFAGNPESSMFPGQGMSDGCGPSAGDGEFFRKQGMESSVHARSEPGGAVKAVRERSAMAAGAPMAKDCFGGDEDVCPATVETWRKLFRKIFGGNGPPKKD